MADYYIFFIYIHHMPLSTYLAHLYNRVVEGQGACSVAQQR